jgi:hypothetical protein
MGNDITFVVSNADFVGFSNSRVDTDNLVIRGVTMITGNLTADGHDLHVDDTTIKQLHELAVKRGKVPVTLEHTGGIKDVNGYLTNFSIQGNKLKADWHLLQYHDETPVMLERAEKQPETFGLSVAFKGKGVQFNGKKCARAEKLLSADCVKRPAAAPDGLFSAKENNGKVDIQQKNMDEQMQNQQTSPELNQIMEALQGIHSRLDAFEEVQGQLVDHINESVDGDGEGFDEVELLSALYNASDEELDAFNAENGTNITREQIEADVNAYNASIDAQGGDDAGYGEGDEGAYAGASQGAESAALSALARDVIELKARDRQEKVAAKAEAEAIEFAELQENIALIVEQRDRLVELSERVIAENEALRMAGVRGGRPAGAGAEIEFKERHQGGSIIEFEEVVNSEFNRLVKAGLNEIKAKSKAIDFGVKRHPVSYQLWRKRGNPEIQFSAE